MPQIEVERPFVLNHGDAPRYFKPGVYDVDQAVAEHPFTKAHLKDAPVVPHPHEGDASPVGIVAETIVRDDQTADKAIQERFVAGKDTPLGVDTGNVYPSSQRLGGDDKAVKDNPERSAIGKDTPLVADTGNVFPSSDKLGGDDKFTKTKKDR